MNLLQEQGAVDELGIGIVRDAFANYFFPGTSTIQTRAKYLLIVPYLLKEVVDGRYGKDINRILRTLDTEEKQCGVRFMQIDSSADGIIGKRVLPKGWVARKPSDIYWNGIRTYGIFKDSQLSIKEYISLAVKLSEKKAAIKVGNRNDDAIDSDQDDADAGDWSAFQFWNLPVYHADWKDNLTIELTAEEAAFLKGQMMKACEGTLLAYLLSHNIDVNTYDSFASLTEALSQDVDADMAYMMKLACDFNELVYMARVRYNVMLSEGNNEAANNEWEWLSEDCGTRAGVDLSAVFEKLGLYNPKTYAFLSMLQTCFIEKRIEDADKLIKQREERLKGPNRAKLNRRKEYNPDNWVGGGWLDYRFSDAKRIINDIRNGEVNADV